MISSAAAEYLEIAMSLLKLNIIFSLFLLYRCVHSLNIPNLNNVKLPKLDIKQQSVLSSTLAIMISLNFNQQPVNALIAPLAEVGVKEFLVKDGKQWLRLSQPVGKKHT